MVTRKARKTCPAGKILRHSYLRATRKGKKVHVRAACINDVGNPGKGLPGGERGIGPLKSGDLIRFGYGNVVSLSEGRRHLALARAVAAYGSLTVFRKLNAVYVYTRRTAPASSAIFKADRDWVREHWRS
jgi:hypothetical protein